MHKPCRSVAAFLSSDASSPTRLGLPCRSGLRLPARRARRWLPGLTLLATCSATSSGPGLAQSIRRDLYVTNGRVHAVAVSPGTVYIGGTFTRAGPATGSAAPFDAATGQPLSIPKVAGKVWTVAAEGFGGWYLGGEFTCVAGQPRSNLAHIQADYTLSAWSPNADGAVPALAVSGRVPSGLHFVRLETDGRRITERLVLLR